ncbi:MAG TPA: ACT domain-containing protein [Methylomirabilota bacterium]|nr:ACT domain-containing protein [Methylomirabilota bacterium]
MAQVKQVTVTAESRPGVLAKVCRALADAGVNIIAICAADTGGRGKLRMVVSDPARARQALADAKIRSGEEPALMISLDDRPGSLGRVAERLAAAKINIKCTYATTGGAGGAAHVVIVVPNPDKAERALA